VVAHRRIMLIEPHVAPLAEYVEGLRRANPGVEFPDFDPFDGGINARVIFLFEKPGPGTSVRGKGSGFISRNNDDRSAEATFGFMLQIGLPRSATVTWNVVPGWNGRREILPAELRGGIADLSGLLPLLPRLRRIVLVGKRAKRARPLLEPLGLEIFHSDHPSPIVRARSPTRWAAIPHAWQQAAVGLEEHGEEGL
jgi:hypothetical protein